LFQALQNPLGWCWLIWVIVTALLFRRSERKLSIVTGSACLFLTLFGGTPLSAWLLARLEHPTPMASLPTRADAIVVLGGSYTASQAEPAGFKASSAFDRITTGLALVDRGISTNLVLGGGIDPVAEPRIHDSEALRPWLERRIPANVRIRIIDSSATTLEEAIHFAPMATREQWTRIVLVTSASHLPRATAAFRSEGIQVIPMACAFEGHARLNSHNRWTLIPNTGDLRLAGMWFHEQVGSLYYRLRGWSTD
jgi:uncharacterized SAM-binding protein YcdF (DUF218 family)